MQEPSRFAKPWSARAAAVWAFAFAALNVFWAFGGTTGAHPFEQQPDPLLLPANLGAALVKVLLGLLALAAVAPWGARLPGLLVSGVNVAAGLVMTLHGLFGLVGNALVLSGALDLGRPVTHWYWYFVLVWDPVWLLGGVLFLLTAAVARARR
ncbi:DUF3995 domain-containing protein [Saccharopolyspora sp. HNM0983]|uniref:DUF3995 domain-containing protein n=1 Tax=Saccharopolyspora montiporae TaxID=2781240 RepID=A0A929BCX9_9PSEU|nr:DUF3995 domain-containing protein [Saccharopolyspora sp. HNM0983]